MYKIEIVIFEGKGGELARDDSIIYPDAVKEGIYAWTYRGDDQRYYQPGQRFSYPEDWRKIYPWLASNLDPIIQTLPFGGPLGWQYSDTPYEKEFDPNGITTEIVRCIDLTNSGIFIKVSRTNLNPTL